MTCSRCSIRDSQNWRNYKSSLAPDRSDSFAMQGTTSDILVAAAKNGLFVACEDGRVMCLAKDD
jgi:hypothetical protein